MKDIYDTITFVAAIILFSAPISLIVVFGESIVKTSWLLGYYFIYIVFSFILMGLKYSVVQDIGRDMGKVFLIFSLSGTSIIIIFVFFAFFAIRAMGYDIPSFAWACFYLLALVLGYPKFKEREDIFIMLKKSEHNNKRFREEISKTKEQIR